MPLADPRRLIAWLLGLLAGGSAALSFWIANPLSMALLDLVAMLITLALLLGIASLALLHVRAVLRRDHGWLFSLALLVALGGAFIAGLLPTLLGPGYLATTGFVFRYLYQPLAGALLALLAFFALRAAWRAFQVRPGEAALVVGSAALVLVAQGPWTAIAPQVAAVLEWLQAYPVLGVARGVVLGVGIGVLVASARVLLGLDQPYLDQ